MGDISNTQYFKAVQEDKKLEVGEVLREVYEALTEKGIQPDQPDRRLYHVRRSDLYYEL